MRGRSGIEGKFFLDGSLVYRPWSRYKVSNIRREDDGAGFRAYHDGKSPTRPCADPPVDLNKKERVARSTATWF